MIIFLKLIKFYFRKILLLFYSTYKDNFIIRNDYWYRICKSSVKKDYYKWILSDKYIAKLYGKKLGFDIPKTYYIFSNIESLNTLNLPNNYVIKPTDLCDGTGVFLINNEINLSNSKSYTRNNIVTEMKNIRKSVTDKYYMYWNMFNGKIPFKGYIAEELLLDNNDIPTDYKCYVFNGKVHFIALTYERTKIEDNTFYKTCWYNRNFQPVFIKMSKKNYYYKHLDKPKNFNKMIQLVENASIHLERHCRIDVYNINGKIYLSEFTFFCGAFLHSFLCNMILGILWEIYPDTNTTIKNIDNLVPCFYNKI